MTLSALLLSFLSIVPKPCPEPALSLPKGAQPERDQRIDALEGRIETLEIERDRALEGVELVQAQLDRAIERIASLERCAARDRDAYHAMMVRQAMGQQPLQQAQALGQGQGLGLALQSCVHMLNQMPNNAQQAQAAQQMAMYTMQNDNQMRQNAWDQASYDHICNCAPARHDMFRPRRNR